MILFFDLLRAAALSVLTNCTALVNKSLTGELSRKCAVLFLVFLGRVNWSITFHDKTV